MFFKRDKKLQKENEELLKKVDDMTNAFLSLNEAYEDEILANQRLKKENIRLKNELDEVFTKQDLIDILDTRMDWYDSKLNYYSNMCTSGQVMDLLMARKEELHDTFEYVFNYSSKYWGDKK